MKNNTMKNAPRFINDTQVLVTKEFAKNAMIFGSSEYKLWREIRKDVPDAEMVTKTIKKNLNKNISTKNLTYDNMKLFIREQENAATLMVEFKKTINLSKSQHNPYRYVLAWYLQKFEDHNSYKDFFAKLAEEEAKKNDIFAEEEYASVVNE